MNFKKVVYMALGCIGIILGAVGAVVPLLPAFPFLMLAAFSFAKSSDRLHTWFIGTKLYKSNLDSFIKGKGMAWKIKFRIMAVVTLTMALGFIMMSKVPAGRMILVIVWLCHLIYFVFGIKTISSPKEDTSVFPFFTVVEIGGMHCENCAKSLECSLNKQSCVNATVNYEDRLAVIQTNRKIDEELLTRWICAAGYSPKSFLESGAN